MRKKNTALPFKIGEMVEVRSFIPGYRGAWFRCKIKEVGCRKGSIGYSVEYVDFPDEKIKWTLAYQKTPVTNIKAIEIKRELMVRPPFPQMYRESEMSHSDSISVETVIGVDVWKLGDLVDWWVDGCYWSGTITQLLGNDKVKLQLPCPPWGENLTYDDVCCKELRPSLEWSPEDGWIVPIPKEGGNCRPCAKLIKPVMQAADSLPQLEHESNKNMATEDFGLGKTSCFDSVSRSLFRDSSDIMAEPICEKDEYCNGGSSKRMRSSGSIPLNLEGSDTLEATILDLEELANKVRWLKGILKSGTPSNDYIRPSWKFVEHHGTFPPK